MFAKSAKANINAKEKIALKELAKEFLNFNQGELDRLVQTGDLIKIGIYDE